MDKICYKCTDEHFEQDTPVLSVEEVEHSLKGMAPGTEQPEIAIDADQSIFTRQLMHSKQSGLLRLFVSSKLGMTSHLKSILWWRT
jgi:hypothetical protein